MAKVQRVCLDEIIGYFDDLEDPRDTVNRKHPLVSVVIIALMAVLSGAAGRPPSPAGLPSRRSSSPACCPCPTASPARTSFAACWACCNRPRSRRAS